MSTAVRGMDECEAWYELSGSSNRGTGSASIGTETASFAGEIIIDE